MRHTFYKNSAQLKSVLKLVKKKKQNSNCVNIYKIKWYKNGK